MKVKSLFRLLPPMLLGSASLAVAQIDSDIVVIEPGDINVDILIPDIPDQPDLPQVASNFDYGDAPDPSYPTLHANNGARHFVAPSPDGFLLTLGTHVDTELDGQPTPFASGDDALGPFDDEDGVAFLNPLQPGAMAKIEVWASGGGRLDAWADFNKNGSWMDPGEQIFHSEHLAANLNVLAFAVPGAAVPGDTCIRFRLSSQGMLAPIGAAQDGEVEDYLVKIEEDGGPNPNAETDWGDASNTYPVTASNSGAFHFLSNDLMLGSAVDSEGNGQPSINADRDDIDSAVDDEDGITFTSPIFQGGLTTLDAVASGPGRIDAWVDFNGDGVWDHPGEQIFSSHPVVAGVNSLSFLIPPTAAAGGTYARFRISSGGGLAPGGGASDGEVEDYHFGLEGGGQPNGEFDWGDAPGPYLTLDNVSPMLQGAHHLIANGLYMGTRCDPEPDGQPDPWALGDDNNGVSDEDGVFFSPLQQGVAAQIGVIASAPGYINAFLDLNGDGDWDDIGEVVVLNGVAVPGMNVYNFTVPSSAVGGDTFARIRINSTGGLGSRGPASDGEVEDYRVHIKPNQPPVLMDWGDAPDSYRTLEASNGASHEIDDLFLGKRIDPEGDGQPSPLALGDDSDGSDDEDGVRFLTPMISGSYALVRVHPSITGILDAWVDFDGDGSWVQSSNQIFNSVTVHPGMVLAFKVPKIKKPLKTFARFRLSHGGADFKGDEVGGEVEDYRVRIGKHWKWALKPELKQGQLMVNWEGQRGMNFTLQTSTTPQEWIRENLGEYEVPRVDELFPSGLAWNDESPVSELAIGPVSDGENGDDGFPMGEWVDGPGEQQGIDDSSMASASTGGPVGDVSEDMYPDRGKSSPKIAHGIRIDPSKKMVLFRVIAMPE